MDRVHTERPRINNIGLNLNPLHYFSSMMADPDDVELVSFSGLRDSPHSPGRHLDTHGIVAPPKPEDRGSFKDKLIRYLFNKGIGIGSPFCSETKFVCLNFKFFFLLFINFKFNHSIFNIFIINLGT